jgi:ribosomal protein S18 acetylase RimI-like enzyme
MTDFQNLVIAPLNPAHDRTGFQCGAEALDRYLKKQAKQDIKRRVSRVFVATKPDDPKSVVGYYTLSTLSIELNQLPEKLARKLPKHPVPAALIGRLAVSNTAQGQGVGKMLLADAIKRTLAVSDQIAIFAMVVDALNDSAREFYEQFGFTRLIDDNPRLFLPLKSTNSV